MGGVSTLDPAERSRVCRAKITVVRPAPGGGFLVRVGASLWAQVDAQDLATVCERTWAPQTQPDGRIYAVSSRTRRGQRKVIRMHRLILDASEDQIVDHRDGDGLNNRRDNIRVATYAQNTWNSRPHRTGRSRFKGVQWDSFNERWRAQIIADGKRRSLGRFATEEEAARAYDAVARTAHGEFARLNFPNERAA